MIDFTKKVSVLMSVFGYEKYIEASIKSILDQTLKDFELIIVDDGCNYDLSGIVNGFKDKRIRYFKNKKNIGLTNSLIKGIELSRGKYLARLDAGNLAFKRRLKIQYDFLEKNTEYYLIGSSFELIDEDDDIVCNVIANTDTGYIKNILLEYNCINHSTIMFRNKGEITYRNKFRYSQDYDLYLNLLSRNYILGNIPEILTKERLIPSSITYARSGMQAYFKDLARQLYLERINTGSDSYNTLKIKEPPTEEITKSRALTEIKFFYKQKIHYLLYSGRTRKVRKQVFQAMKAGFDFKLLVYYFMSLFPVLTGFYGRRRGFTYE